MNPWYIWKDAGRYRYGIGGNTTREAGVYVRERMGHRRCVRARLGVCVCACVCANLIETCDKNDNRTETVREIEKAFIETNPVAIGAHESHFVAVLLPCRLVSYVLFQYDYRKKKERTDDQ